MHNANKRVNWRSQVQSPGLPTLLRSCIVTFVFADSIIDCRCTVLTVYQMSSMTQLWLSYSLPWFVHVLHTLQNTSRLELHALRAPYLPIVSLYRAARPVDLPSSTRRFLSYSLLALHWRRLSPESWKACPISSSIRSGLIWWRESKTKTKANSRNEIAPTQSIFHSPLCFYPTAFLIATLLSITR